MNKKNVIIATAQSLEKKVFEITNNGINVQLVIDILQAEKPQIPNQFGMNTPRENKPMNNLPLSIIVPNGQSKEKQINMMLLYQRKHHEKLLF